MPLAPQMTLVTRQHQRGPGQRGQQRADLIAAQVNIIDEQQRVNATQMAQQIVGVQLDRKRGLKEGVE